MKALIFLLTWSLPVVAQAGDSEKGKAQAMTLNIYIKGLTVG